MTKDNNHNKYVNKKITKLEYLSPEYSYFKLINNNVKYAIKSNEQVFKESLLFTDSYKNEYANISGTVMGLKNS